MKESYIELASRLLLGKEIFQKPYVIVKDTCLSVETYRITRVEQSNLVDCKLGSFNSEKEAREFAIEKKLDTDNVIIENNIII